MWTIVLNTLNNNCTDEFYPLYNQEKALALFLPNGFCIAGLYAALQSRQYYVILCNCNFGLWFDTEADYYKTWQYRLWRWIAGILSKPPNYQNKGE